MDTIYKVVVVVGGVAIGYMNATYARKDDLTPIHRALEEIKTDVKVIRGDFSHIDHRIREMNILEKEMESRLRAVEIRR